MTHYITGDCDTKICAIDHERGSFKPAFQHVFKEIYPPTYVSVDVDDGHGGTVERIFDLCRRRFIK